MRDRRRLRVYVLTRNEEANIAKCLTALRDVGAHTTVLDSGSTDGTLGIVEGFDGISVRRHDYLSHEQSYNDLTLSAGDEWVMVLDADMEIGAALWNEIEDVIERRAPPAIGSPVRYCVEGRPLAWASLYPPKVYVFKGGRSYFDASGHGERLKADVRPVFTKEELVHNDLKGYRAFLGAQVFYGSKIIERCSLGKARWYDRIRLHSPFMAMAMGLRSLIIRPGWLDGRAGLVYAIDRMIAELIFFRLSLAEGLKRPAKSTVETPDSTERKPQNGKRDVDARVRRSETPWVGPIER